MKKIIYRSVASLLVAGAAATFGLGWSSPAQAGGNGEGEENQCQACVLACDAVFESCAPPIAVENGCSKKLAATQFCLFALGDCIKGCVMMQGVH